MSFLKFCILVLLSCNCTFFHAQQPSFFTFGEKEFEGIDIYDMIQDKEFNYWIATDQGIFKHDGYTFEKIECEEMTSNSVFNFVKDSKGIIYCNNLNYQVFKIEDGRCTFFLETPEKSKNYDLSLCIGSKDELIITSGELFIYNSKGELLVKKDISENLLSHPVKLKDGTIYLHEANTQNIIVIQNGKVSKKKLKINKELIPEKIFTLQMYLFNGKIFAFDRYSKNIYTLDEKSHYLDFKSKMSIKIRDEYSRYYAIENKFWAASSVSGVTVFDKDLKQIYSSDKIYSNYFISDIFEDAEGNVILSTFDKGFLIIPNLSIPDVIPNLESFNLSRITSDLKGKIFLGTKEGKVLIYEKDKIYPISNTGIKSIEMLQYYPEKDILIFDDYGMSTYTCSSKEIKTYLYGSLKDVALVKNELFFAFNTGLNKMIFNKKTGLFERQVLENFNSRCTLVEFDPTTDFLYINSTDGLKIQYPNGKVSLLTFRGKSIFPTDIKFYKDKLIMSTREKGILFAQKDKILKQINPKANNKVVDIYKFQIHKETIYANSSDGLILMDFNGEIKVFLNKSFGISTNKIIDFYVDDSYLWIVHARGLQKISLDKIRKKKIKPNIKITSILKNDRTFDTKLNRFEANEKKVKFVFSVLTIRERENIRYHYKLFGNDKFWTSSAYDQHEITYNALAPGKYKFVVKAENNGVFSEVKSYSFSILSPFYQKWWFNLLLFFFGFSILTFFYLRKLKIQAKKNKQLNELNASKLTAIQSQMNPHFLFNSLNSIQDLVLKGDVDNSYTFISKFSDLVRRTLSYSGKDFISFDQEIKLIELYLSLEKLRFKDDFSYQIEKENVDDIELPPMLIQPFVENALIHGLLHQEGEKRLSISFRLEENLICEITDNGIGRQKAKEIKQRQRKNHESFSVNATKTRFEILANQYPNIGFRFEDLYDGNESLGTKVILSIPIRRKF